MKNSGLVKKIAMQRIEILYPLMIESCKDEPELSALYAKLINRICRHYRIRLPVHMRKRMCRKCGAVLVPGKNLSVRISSSRRQVIYRCSGCGKETGIKY